jgi:hypothetical protein
VDRPATSLCRLLTALALAGLAGAGPAAATVTPIVTTPAADGTLVGPTLSLGASAPGATEVQYFASGVGPIATSSAPPGFAATVDVAQTLHARNGDVYTLWAVAYDAFQIPSLASYPARTIVADLEARADFVTPSPPAFLRTNAPALTYTIGYAPDIVCVRWRVNSNDPADFTPCLDPATPGAAGSLAAPTEATYSPATFQFLSPGEGAWTLDVSVTDALGNAGVTRRTFTVDRTPPALTIVSGPAEGSTISKQTVTFGFVTEPNVRLQCAIDEPISSLSCSGSSSQTASGLLDGAHGFRIRATDAAGNSSEDARGFNVRLAGTPGAENAAGFVPIAFADSTAGGVTRKHVRATVSLRTTAGKPGRVVRRLAVTGVRYASRIEVRCRGLGCPYKSRTYRVRDGRSRISQHWRGVTLKPGAVVEVFVRSDIALGRYVRYAVPKAGQSVKRTARCLSRYWKVRAC